MTDSEARTRTTAVETKGAPTVDMKLEVVVIPVSDVDRAKEFYERLGWRLDADFAGPDDYRVIQFTPPGSQSSVIFGKNVTAAAPGSARGLYLIVSDIKAARDELVGRGVKVSEVFHAAGDVHTGTDEPYLFGRRRIGGPDPERGSYRSFASFRDPDGNGWLFQEVTARLPGRVDADHTTFTSSTELASALRRAAAAHGEHEKRTGGPRRELAGLVRRLHHPRAGRKGAAVMSNILTKTTRVMAMATLIAGSALAPHAAQAQQAGIKRTDLQRHDLSVPGREAVQVRVDIDPGVAFGKHTHPGEEIIYVIEGTLEYEIEGKPPVTLKAGDVLFIPAGTIHSAKNPGSGIGSELATYIVEKGKPLLTLVK